MEQKTKLSGRVAARITSSNGRCYDYRCVLRRQLGKGAGARSTGISLAGKNLQFARGFIIPVPTF
jgi:hypothetical protein